MLDGETDRRTTVRDVELAVDALQVGVDGPPAQKEALGDLGAGQAPSDETEHLDLSLG